MQRLMLLGVLCFSQPVFAQFALDDDYMRSTQFTDSFAALDPAATTERTQGIQDEFADDYLVPMDLNEPGKPASVNKFEPVPSFPLRVVNGKSAGLTAQLSDKSAPVPMKARKQLKVRGCNFTVHTSNFVVSRHQLQMNGGFELVSDALPKLSTLTVNDNNLFASTSAFLTATVDKADKKTCAAALKGKRFYIGKMSLDGSEFIANGPGVASAKTVVKSEGTKLYVEWNPSLGGLVLENELGMQPEIDSGIQQVTMAAQGTYALGLRSNIAMQNP
jgi:hypothetical protein